MENKVKAYFDVDTDKGLFKDEFKKVRVGVYGLAIKDGKLLVVRVYPQGEENIEKVYLRNPMWDVPGGGIEPGENIIAALEREFFEETGVKILVGRLWHVGQAHYCNAEVPMTNVQIYYLVNLKNENFKPARESLEAQWSKVDEFSRKNSLPGLYQILDKIKSELL